MSIDQQAINDGQISLRKLLESGRHFFSTPFSAPDGFGEGPAGPRRSYQQLMPSPMNPFLRLNGIDSQSCFECHNSIGSINWRDTKSEALSRKPGVTGGPAGFASSAFINDDFPTTITKFVRNPPHVFGTGYAQRLAEEMTEELLTHVANARLAAQADPDVRVEEPLSAKGTSFGTFATTFLSASDTFVDEFDAVEGVSADFVVRPFQWKGIASTERNFVRDALNFHFSIQAVENFFAEDPMNPGEIIITNTDQDADGHENEMSVGNVTALTVFTLMIRPPAEIVEPGTEAVVARGRAIFEATAGDIDFSGTQMCASCHTPSLHIDSPVVVVRDPSNPANLPQLMRGWRPTLGVPARSSADLPVMREFERKMDVVRRSPVYEALREGRGGSPAETFEILRGALLAVDSDGDARGETPPPIGYSINLTTPGSDLPPFVFPRLPDNLDGSIDVPLFSDLRRHRMSAEFADPVPQQTDAAGVFVPAEEFLTRPLWGVADTGPWLFDGRATTLRQAIEMHEGTGSEANPVIAVFNGLSEDDKSAVVSFLLTLQLPIESSFYLPGSLIVR